MSIQVSSNPETIAPNPASSAMLDGYLFSLVSRLPALNLTTLDVDIAALVQGLREHALLRLQELQTPTTRDEEWRFTDLSSLVQVEFQAADRTPPIDRTQLDPFLFPEAAQSRLVFVNGVYSPELSNTEALPEGVMVTNLLSASGQSQGYHHLGKQPGGDEVFAVLNTAGLADAALVLISANQTIAPPIHLLFVTVSGTTSALNQPRCLVVAGTGSSATLIEEYVGIGQGADFINAVTEIWVEPNARVHHSRVQRESTSAFHIGRTAVSQGRDSHYTCNAVSLGARLSRHNLEVMQTGEQTETILNGLTLIGGEQVADTHSAIVYTKPHGRSRQLHKCIVDDRAHGVFNGKVFVSKAAQLTDAGQINRNLLLSPKARIDTKPQLEIIADNVKCSHGATVSQLDEEEVFYLQSRGLDQATSQKLLIYGFAIEVINQIPVPSLQNTLSQVIKERAF
ncbi:MAG: Fe-S cluster assembly protein SufD [Leptolyngbyaceae cyanobacterium bins.59]|nr:Fe-S cluster assembly protein SufD [Leptolyngbyaceae cyanobacterium bins.59]